METRPDSADSGLGTVNDSYGYENDSHHIKGAEFLDQLSDYWHLKQSTTNEQCTRNNWKRYFDLAVGVADGRQTERVMLTTWDGENPLV
jgi:hypothetical protein